MVTKYKNIIFDLGNVLIDFKPLDYVRSKIDDFVKADEVYQCIFRSPEWLMIDRGIVTEENAINSICDHNPELSSQIRLVMTDWYHMLTLINDVFEILQELKHKGYKLYFLSNYQLLAYEYILKEYPLFAYFDGGIFSFKEQLLKPEPEIYERLMKTYALRPEESIFIDDMKENIEAALNLGFSAIHFTSSAELREELQNYKV